MIYILLGLLFISIALNSWLYIKNKKLQKIIEQHSDALTEHVGDIDKESEDQV